jgi:hypothetical protein
MSEVTLYRKGLSDEYALKPGPTRNWIPVKFVEKDEADKLVELLAYLADDVPRLGSSDRELIVKYVKEYRG